MKLRAFCLLFFSLPLYALFNDVFYEESFLPLTCPKNPTGQIFESLFEAYQCESMPTDTYIIPKLIHFIWLGSPLPSFCRKMIATWKRKHPDWITIVWTDEMIARFGLQNQSAFERAKNYGEKSDIARYEILYRYGGVYADTDFECLKPFDKLHQSCELYAGVNGDNECLLNGLIGAMPGHPVMKACIDHIKPGLGDHSETRIMNDTGPYLFTRMFLQEHSKGKVPFPPSFFYSFPAILRNTRASSNEIKKEFTKPESFAIHYWASSWMCNKS